MGVQILGRSCIMRGRLATHLRVQLGEARSEEVDEGSDIRRAADQSGVELHASLESRLAVAAHDQSFRSTS